MFNKITPPRYGFRALAAVAAALALLSSCSVDQPVNISGSDGISFRATVGASTKAAEVNASNLTGFNVTAIGNGESYFSDMEVSVSSGTCTPARTYYWPSYELGFYAYANVSGGTVSIENSAKTITGVTPAAAASEQTDMIVAYETGDKEHNESSGVPLNFRHALSQVVVKAANLSTSGIQIKVAGVKLGNILDRGTFTYPATTTTTQNSGTLSQSLWNTSAAEYTDYVISKEATDTVLASTAKSIMFGGAAWMVVPQQLTARASFADGTDEGSSIGVMVQILDANNGQLYPATAGEYAYTNIPIDTDWEPGKKYTYTLNFLDEANGGGAGVDDDDNPVLGKPIRFTLTVDDWDPQDIPGVTFAGLQVSSGPLFYNGSSYELKNEWNYTSYGSAWGKEAGSTFFSYIEMGKLFADPDFSDAHNDISNTLDPFSGWRIPTADEWYAIKGINHNGAVLRPGSTVNGSPGKHFAYLQLTGVSYAGSTTPYGMLVFPDNESITGRVLSDIDTDNSGRTENVSLAELNVFLTQGCLFIPACGGAFDDGTFDYGGDNGYYWTSEGKNASVGKYVYMMSGNSFDAGYDGEPYDLICVRLVKNQELTTIR